MSDFVSATPSRVRLADLLASSAEVVTESDGWVIVCPAHPDGHPSLRVAISTSGALLLHCRAGCAKAAVVEALGLDWSAMSSVDTTGVTAVSTNSPDASVSDRDLLALSAYIDRAAGEYPSSPAAAYAAERFGVSESLAAVLRLGYDSGYLPSGALGLSATAYRAHPRLVVPFLSSDGSAIGLQARALSPAAVRWSGPVNPAGGGHWSAYGVMRADTGHPDAEVLITEGPGDALTACAAGFDSVCVRGAALGASAKLADTITEVVSGRRVVVAGDSDTAGRGFTAAVCAALSSRGIHTRRLDLPDGVGDLTDWRAADPDGFPTELASAIRSSQMYTEDDVLADRLTAEAARIFTDVENARSLYRYITDLGADVRWTPERDWLVYPGHHVGTWHHDTTDQVRTWAHEAAGFIQRTVMSRLHEVERRALALTDGPTKSRAMSAIARTRSAAAGGLVAWTMSSRGIDAMLKELRALNQVSASFTAWDSHRDLLAVANGVVSLETGTLRPYGDETKSELHLRRVPVPYLASARNPRWERFVSEVHAEHPELVEYVQRLVGYAMTGYTSESCISVWLGGGANGKSVLLETLTALFPQHVVITPMSTFERRDMAGGGASPDIARIAGARIVVASEGEQGRPMAEALLKRLSGGESVTARFLYRDEMTFVPQCQIILVTNHPPAFKGQDNGLWRRLRLLPFTRTFSPSEQDRHLIAKLTGAKVPASAHLPTDDFGDGPAGILAWVVRGAMMWADTGLHEPDIVSAGTTDLRETSDQLADFIAEHLVRDPDGIIKAAEAYLEYQAWAEAEGLQGRDVWRRKTLITALTERGARQYVAGGTVTLRGFRKRTVRDLTPEEGHSVLSEMRPVGESVPNTDEFAHPDETE